MQIVTVITSSPLTILEDGATTAIPANLIRRDDGFSPGAGARVLAELVGHQLYVFAAAGYSGLPDAPFFPIHPPIGP